MDNKDIKKRIRGLRESLGYTQEEVANSLKMSQNSYRQLESGKTLLISKRLDSLATILKTTVSELLIGVKPETAVEERLVLQEKQHKEEIEQIQSDFKIKSIEQEDEIKRLKMALESKESIIGILRENLNKYRQ
ncbi:MAG: helix-turn-helix domain-containing protein [Bacteroidales bacterium]|nr:helix-turn-helix domain-containing protein [Bacteroidales bacterium]